MFHGGANTASVCLVIFLLTADPWICTALCKTGALWGDLFVFTSMWPHLLLTRNSLCLNSGLLLSKPDHRQWCVQLRSSRTWEGATEVASCVGDPSGTVLGNCSYLHSFPGLLQECLEHQEECLYL